MATFLNKLARLLVERFPGARVDLEPFVPRPYVGGFVVWDGFLGVDPVERTRLIWDAMRERLGRDELRRVALILGMTPVEMEIRRENLEREHAESKRSRVRAKSS